MNYAHIQKLNYVQQPYEFIMSGIKIIPWYGKPYEWTYMNNTKLLNQDPVKTYDNLRLYSDSQIYKKFKSPIYEGFSDPNNKSYVIIAIFLALLCLFVCCQ